MTKPLARWVLGGVLFVAAVGCEAMRHGHASKTKAEAMDLEPKPKVETPRSPSPFAPFHQQ